jgi:enamine deaminase RidA (YjgF/YER057c/UK114 family)
MSQAVVHGDMVYTAGQVAINAAGENATKQTEDILASIDALLAEAGTDKSKILSANIWLSDMNDFSAMNEVWDAWVVAGATPTRACVESKLAAPKFTVEIAVTAVVC